MQPIPRCLCPVGKVTSPLPPSTVTKETPNAAAAGPPGDEADGPGIVDFLLGPHVHSSVEMYERGGESVWPVDLHAHLPFPALGWAHLLGVSGSPSVSQRCP